MGEVKLLKIKLPNFLDQRIYTKNIILFVPNQKAIKHYKNCLQSKLVWISDT